MRPFAVLAVLVLSACLGAGPDGLDPGGPSPPLYAILPAEAVWVASSVDGKRLDHAVFRPDTDEPVPVFINFSPYWGDSAMAGGDAFARYMVSEFVPRGYAVVLSAVRGTGHSEGCFQIGGDLELQDAYDVIEHFANEPWSNGHVGAGGKSYDSTTQNGLIAKMPHPALKAVFHVSGITDMYRYSYVNGVPYANGLQFTPRYYATQGLDEYAGITNGAGGLDDEDPESLARLLDDVACTELPRHVASGQGTAVTGLKDAYWQERDWNRDLPEADFQGSVFFVHGLQDWNVKPDHILPWLELLQEKQVPTLAWLHQDSWPGSGGHVYPMRADWNETMLAWLDWSLKGHQNGFEERFGFEVEGSDGVWRASDAWPPTEAAHTPSVSTVGGGSCAGRSWTAVTFGREPDTVRVVGTPTVRVAATPLTADPVYRAVLWDVNETAATWVGEAVRRGALTDDLETVAPILPGAAVEVELAFYPVDHVIEAGHAWRLELGVPCDAAPPTTMPHTGTVITPAQAQVAYPLGAAMDPTRVVLPTAPMAAGAQPEPMDCFVC